jgi:hypothetical protein
MKKTIITSVIALATIFVIASWTSAPDTNSTTATNGAITDVVAFPHYVVSPCNGDTIDMDGNVHTTMQTVNMKNGNVMIIHHANFAGISGTGRTGGDEYNCVSAQNQKVVISGNTQDVDLNFVQNLIGKGSAPNMTFHGKLTAHIDFSTNPPTVTQTITMERQVCK